MILSVKIYLKKVVNRIEKKNHLIIFSLII